MIIFTMLHSSLQKLSKKCGIFQIYIPTWCVEKY